MFAPLLTGRVAVAPGEKSPAGAIAPQPRVGNEPLGHHRGGILEGLRRRLRPTDNGLGMLFCSRVQQDAEPPRGVRTPPPEALRVPVPDALTDPKLLRRGARAAHAVSGGGAVRKAPADRAAVCRIEACKQLRRLFGAAPCGVAEALIERLLCLAVPGLRPYEDPLLLGTVLARLHGSDALRAAQVLHGLQSEEPRDDAFAAQRALARCGGPGIDCLLRLAPQSVPQDEPLPAAVRREAFTARLRTADRLCESLPARLRPRSLAGCVALARRVTQAGSDSPEAVLLAGRELLMHGLLCAQSLAEDPESKAPPDQRCAYLAVRNGIFDTATLRETQDRLFKINTYIDRASERGVERAGHAVQRLFGYQKSPLHAIPQLGTAQSKTRHPRDDVATRCVAMDMVIDRLNAQLAALPADQRRGDTAMRKSVRLALVRHWKRHIVDRGWQDTLWIGDRMRRDITFDVARQLECCFDTVAAFRPLRKAGPLAARTLERWAAEEGLGDAVRGPWECGEKARGFDEAMTVFLQMENGGDRLLRRPTPEQVRELLRQALQDTRQTYSVGFASGNTMGVLASVLEILSITPALAGVGPTLGVTGSRWGVVRGGSNLHGGELHSGSQRGGHLDFGISGFLGKKFSVLTLGLHANATPLAVDYSVSRSAVVRTRMNAFGATDGEAWRRLLLEAFDCITCKDAEPGPPDDAQQMWRQLAGRFYRDPNLSIDATRARQTTFAASATATIGARVALDGGVQAGPAATLGFGRTYQDVLRQQDHRGDNRRTEISSSRAGHGGVASIGLTGLAPSITGGAIGDNAGQPGAAQALTLSAASLGTKSVAFLRNASGATLRLVTDQGRIDPDYSVKDTETGSAGSFARYIDSHRQDWLAAIGGKDPAAELDTFLTRLRSEETRGNLSYGERRRLTPSAALRIDHFRALEAATGPSRPDETSRLRGQIDQVLTDPASWYPRALFVINLNRTATQKGLSIILQLLSHKQVSAPRQCNAIVAGQAPRAANPDESIF